MSHINPIALIGCLGSACHLCKVHELQTNVCKCLLSLYMHLTCYGINTLATLIHHVHCCRNSDGYVMLAHVINNDVECHLFLWVENIEKCFVFYRGASPQANLSPD